MHVCAPLPPVSPPAARSSLACLLAPQKSTGTVNESLKDDAFGVIQGFTGYSSALVSDLSAQIRARKRYDDEYLANKTRAVEEINARNAEKLKELQSELDALGLNITLDIGGSLLSNPSPSPSPSPSSSHSPSPSPNLALARALALALASDL